MMNNSDNQTPILFNFDDWFQNHGGVVVIFLNENNSDKSFEDFDEIKKWALNNKYWLFFKQDKITKKFSFEYLPKNTLFLYNGNEVNLNNYANYIIQIKNKWNKSIPFPDIQINQGNQDSIFIDKINKTFHKMYLHPDIFNNFNDFKFSLGHELSHLDFPEKDFEKIIEKQSFFNFDIIQIIFLFNLFTFIYTFINAKTQADFIATGLMLFTPLLLGALILTSFLTFKKRMINYTKEFFCDVFSMSYVGSVKENNLGLLSHNYFNVYSHPSDKHRIDFYRKMSEDFNNHKLNLNNLKPEDFKPPNLKYPFLFKYLNFVEIAMIFKKKKKS